MDKRSNETWHRFIIRKYREGSEGSFTIFLDKFFNITGYTEIYREGMAEEKSFKKPKPPQAPTPIPKKKKTAPKADAIDAAKGFLF